MSINSESVYLPTNSNCRVVGIVTTSGMPMQSAARVPILVSFEVEEYPGPDNDPILTQGCTTQIPEINIDDRSLRNDSFKLKVKENSRTSSLSSHLMKKNMKRVNSARKLNKQAELMSKNDESIILDEN